MDIYFVTTNKHKFVQARSVLSKFNITLHQLVEEKFEPKEWDIEKVAGFNAKELANKTNKPVVVDDTGIFFDAYENFPAQNAKWVFEKIGYKGIELRKTQVPLETPYKRVKEYARIIKDYGLEVICMTPRGYPVLDDEGVFIRYLELSKKFNCQIIKIGGNPEKIRRCAEIAQVYDIRIGSNNHIGTDDKPGPAETIERTVDYLKRVNHPNFGILYDAAHLFMSGSEYGPEAVKKIKDKIFYVLVQYPVETDKEDAELKFHNRYFRSGIIGEHNGPDFRRVFEGLKKINYQGYIGVISPRIKGKDSEEIAKVYYQKIKEMLGERR